MIHKPKPGAGDAGLEAYEAAPVGHRSYPSSLASPEIQGASKDEPTSSWTGIGLIEAALGYARLGIAVFPIWPALPFRDGGYICGCGRLSCKDPAKHPIGSIVPHGLRDASAEEKLVRHFWTGFPNANIGGVTGDIVVIDLDPRHGGSVPALERQYGPFPQTWRVTTGGGGDHLYFKAPASACIANSAGKLGEGIDVRGRGGYVLMPPSLHISGRRYSWHRGCGPDELPLAPLPTSVTAALNRQKQGQASCPAKWRELAGGNVSEGKRNDSITRLAGHLLRRHVDPHLALELLVAWNACRCTPPLDRAEVIRTVNSIAGKELTRRSGGGR